MNTTHCDKMKFYFTLIFHSCFSFQITRRKKNILIEFIFISATEDMITLTFFFSFVFMLRSLTRRRLFNRERRSECVCVCMSLLPIYNLEKRGEEERMKRKRTTTHTHTQCASSLHRLLCVAVLRKEKCFHPNSPHTLSSICGITRRERKEERQQQNKKCQ